MVLPGGAIRGGPAGWLATCCKSSKQQARHFRPRRNGGGGGAARKNFSICFDGRAQPLRAGGAAGAKGKRASEQKTKTKVNKKNNELELTTMLKMIITPFKVVRYLWGQFSVRRERQQMA
uniref:Uncharacterized protein n=1 Tax=Globodera rostochiensis TaxID=31243 RepID=A0A914HN21_GLORO